MPPSPRGGPAGWIVDYLRRLRFPWLFAITVVIFVVDLLVPDFLPFADEILLGLLAALLGALRRRAGTGTRPSSP